MRRLGPAVLLLALVPPLSGCTRGETSALGQRPTSYPAAGEVSPTTQPTTTATRDRAELLAQAIQAGEAILSYDHRSLDADLARARAQMTPSYRAQFRQLADELQRHTRENELATAATVLRAAVAGSTADRASVLLFVEQLTSTEGGLGETRRNAVLLTLEAGASGWLVASLDINAPSDPVPEASPRRRAVLAAASAVGDAYANLSWQHAEADVATVLALATGPFHDRYAAAAEELIARTTASGATQEGSVVAAGLESLRGGTAVALVSVQGAVQFRDLEPTPRALRLIITLEHIEGSWLASEISLLD